MPHFAARRAASDASGAAETDRHAAVLDDDRDLAPAFGQLNHPFELGRILLDVDVAKGNVPLFVLLTGGGGVGSRVFAEDEDFVNHLTPQFTCDDGS